MCVFYFAKDVEAGCVYCKFHWLVSGYAHVFILLSVLIVLYPVPLLSLSLPNSKVADHFSDSHEPYSWDTWPHDEERAKCGYVGLTNLGATCYMATCMQHLYMIPEARKSVIETMVCTVFTVLFYPFVYPVIIIILIIIIHNHHIYSSIIYIEAICESSVWVP